MLGEQRNQNHTGFWMNIFDLGHFSFRILYSNVLLKIYHIIQVFGAHFLPFEHTFPVIPPTLSYQLSKLQKKFQEENVWGRCCWETFPCMAGRPVPNNASWSLGPIFQISAKFDCNFMQFRVFMFSMLMKTFLPCFHRVELQLNHVLDGATPPHKR